MEHQLLLWLVPALAAVLSSIGLGIWSELRSLREVVQKLAENHAADHQRINGHETRIGRLEDAK